MNTFDQLQKAAEEGAKKWEHIEELATKLGEDTPAGAVEIMQEILLALVDYMRPMAPNTQAFTEATTQIQDLLGKFTEKL